MGLSVVEHSVLYDQHRKLSEAVQLQDLSNSGAERQTILNPIRLRIGAKCPTKTQPGRLNKSWIYFRVEGQT